MNKSTQVLVIAIMVKPIKILLEFVRNLINYVKSNTILSMNESHWNPSIIDIKVIS